MDECRVVRAGSEATMTAQGTPYFLGISTESVGSRGICMHVAELPPGFVGKPHLHEGHETAIYIVSGRSGMHYGTGLARTLRVGPGELLFIPPGVPHQPFNDDPVEPCIAVIARTDPNEQESVVLL